MRFVTPGPDLPEALLFAQEEGRLVFFCGAGVSRPAGLPLFDGLVEAIYKRLNTRFSDAEKSAFDGEKYDTVVAMLEARIGSRMPVREQVHAVLSGFDASSPAATATHRALLTLARDRAERGAAGSVRLVTTNFDRLFILADDSVAQYSAPMLPLPKPTRWNGVVYLHGLLPERPEPQELDRLVLSSGDFGVAYLTERWASRFVTELFRNYTVCFVGYSLSDPILRYVTDALAADRLRGEKPIDVYAFAGHQNGREQAVAMQWAERFVTAIPYLDADNHSGLHVTLQRWANTYRDGLQGKRSVVLTAAGAKPADPDHVGRVLWALCEETGDIARSFATLDPPAPIEWLSILDEPRFGHADLERFGCDPRCLRIPPLDTTGGNEERFSLLRRPYPAKHSPWVALVGAATPTLLDPVSNELCAWLCRHLDKPEALLWAAKAGGSVHASFAFHLRRALATSDLPGCARQAWSILMAGLGSGATLDSPGFYDFLREIKASGWSALRRRELLALTEPRIRFSADYRMALLRGDAVEPERDADQGSEGAIPSPLSFEEAIDAELTLALGSETAPDLSELRKSPQWAAIARDCLTGLTDNLRLAVDLLAAVGKADATDDGTHIHHPSIAPHDQNKYFQTWVVLIDLVRDAWLKVATTDPAAAAAEWRRWSGFRFPIFRRLELFAATRPEAVAPHHAEALVAAEDGRWLWSPETKREAVRLLVYLATASDAATAESIVQLVLRGPRREHFPDIIDHEDWTRWAEWQQFLRLRRWRAASGLWPLEADARLAQIVAKNPKWCLAEDERDEFSHYMTVGEDDWRTRKPLPSSFAELLDALRQRPDLPSRNQEDDWEDICKSNPIGAAKALIALAESGDWPASAWRDGLRAWSASDLKERHWSTLHGHLLDAPAAFVRAVAPALAYWLRALASEVSFAEARPFAALAARLLDAMAEEPLKPSEQPVTQAINHPVGQTTEAVIGLWLRTQPGKETPLAEPFVGFFDKVVSQPHAVFRAGRMWLGARLPYFHWVDPMWVRDKLLPWFEWREPNIEAKTVWEGYLWSPRLSPALVADLKPLLLRCAHHYPDLGKHARQFASLLASCALELADEFEATELRDALDTLPNTGLAEAAQAIARAMAERRDGLQQYVANRVWPVLPGIWPRNHNKRSTNESIGIALVCVYSAEAFAESLRKVRTLLMKCPQTTRLVHELRKSPDSLCSRFPEAALDLLDLVIDTNRPPPPDLSACIDMITASGSVDQSDQRLSRLKALADRFR
jgi:hypothetical protein